MPQAGAYTDAQVEALIAVHAAIVDAHHSPLDIFGKFYELIPWITLDGFTTGGDGAPDIAVQSPRLKVKTDSTTDNDAFVHHIATWRAILTSEKRITFELPITALDSIADQNIWIRLSITAADPPSETVAHFGWKIIGGDLYASNATGTVQTITDTLVNLAAVGQRTRLKVVVTEGTDCKFYVNDILKATHITNLPPVGDYRFHIQVRTLADANKTIYIGRLLVEAEHA